MSDADAHLAAAVLGVASAVPAPGVLRIGMEPREPPWAPSLSGEPEGIRQKREGPPPRVGP